VIADALERGGLPGGGGGARVYLAFTGGVMAGGLRAVAAEAAGRGDGGRAGELLRLAWRWEAGLPARSGSAAAGARGAFSLVLSGARGRGAGRVEFGRVGVGAGPDAGELAARIGGAFREHLGRLPGDLGAHVEVPAGLDPVTRVVVMSAVSRAAAELGRPVSVRMFPWRDPVRLCPP
jgi:hypothetical protein